MISLANDKIAQLTQLQKVSCKLLEDLNCRIVTSQNANQFLDEVHQQIGQMRVWMVENYKDAKKLDATDALNHQLHTLSGTIKRLGKILHIAEITKPFDHSLDQAIEYIAEKKAVESSPRKKDELLKAEMTLRVQKLSLEEEMLSQIAYIQSKIEKFQTPVKRIIKVDIAHLAELGNRQALCELSQAAILNDDLRRKLDTMAQRAIKQNDPSLGNTKTCEDYRIGKYLLDCGCDEEANHWFEQFNHDFKDGARLPFEVILLKELALLGHPSSIALLIKRINVSHECVPVMSELLKTCINADILDAVLDYICQFLHTEYRAALWMVINRPTLSPKTLLILALSHVTHLAYSTFYMPLLNGRKHLVIDRGEREFEDWLMWYISNPKKGKELLLNLMEKKALPPLSGPLTEMMDQIVLSEIRNMHKNFKEVTPEQRDEIVKYNKYIMLKATTGEFKISSCAVECQIRMLQLLPNVMQNVIRDFYKKRKRHAMIKELRELFTRAKTIPGLTLDPDLKFVDFIIHCTAEELSSLTFDHEIETLAKNTAFPTFLTEHLTHILPLYLVPTSLRAYLLDQALPPSRIDPSMMRIALTKLGTPLFRIAVLARLDMKLRNGLPTPLNVTLATFTMKNAAHLKLTSEDPLLHHANRIASSKLFAVGKMI